MRGSPSDRRGSQRAERRRSTRDAEVSASRWLGALGFGLASMALAPAGGDAQDSAPHVSTAETTDTAPETVVVVVEPCGAVPLDAALLVALLRVELSIDGVREVLLAEPGLEPGAGVVAVLRVTPAPCEVGRATFETRLDDLLTQKHVERSFDVAELPASARPRALAIAMAELVRASWSELALAEHVPDTVPLPIVEAMRRRMAEARALDAPTLPPAEPASALPETRTPRTAIAAAFVVRTYPGGRAAPLGGRLALDLVPDRLVVVRIAAEVVLGTSLDPLGRIEIGAALLGLTLGLALTMGDSVFVSLGPRIAGGVAWASGRPYEPTTIAGSGLGPVLLFGGEVELDARLDGILSLRFGVGVDGVAVGQEAYVSSIPVAGISGAGIGAWAGLAIAP